MTTLVDSNVVLDVLTNDPAWLVWSLQALREASRRGPLLINPVIYSELSIGYTSMHLLDRDLEQMHLVLGDIPNAALFRAGKVFQQYRRVGGTRTGVLPDFFIGAHAEASRLALLTRDIRRYRTYFPDVELITPGS